MSDQERGAFSDFLIEWCAANLGTLGDHTDPSDHRFMYGRWAERLREAATAAGLGVELNGLAREYKGGLREYIEGAYDRAEFRRRHGDL